MGMVSHWMLSKEEESNLCLQHAFAVHIFIIYRYEICGCAWPHIPFVLSSCWEFCVLCEYPQCKGATLFCVVVLPDILRLLALIPWDQSLFDAGLWLIDFLSIYEAFV